MRRGLSRSEDLRTLLELGFDESRFFDKAGRMGLAVTRDDALQQFTYMLEEADGYVDLLDWNNLLGMELINLE